MAGIVALTFVSALVLIGLIVAVHTKPTDAPSGWRGCFDRELASIVDRGTAELLADRLANGPLLVPVRIGHRLLGPFLLVDTGTGCLRLQLYNENRKPESPRAPPAASPGSGPSPTPTARAGASCSTGRSVRSGTSAGWWSRWSAAARRSCSSM